LPDYTEGYYGGDPTVPYEQAQARQIEYLLDQVGCQAGSRILDVGCGNGRLLEAVRRRGARGTGVTISPQQVRYCRERGLDVQLLNYRNLGDEFTAQFDAVIANGSLEHFVQAGDAVAGNGDAIYREFFCICHRLIDPHSTLRKLMNTTIHFGRADVSPEDASRSPWKFRWNSDRFHYAWLVRGFGGYYPHPGQLERCAAGLFRLTHARDATFDYYLTSEHWLEHGWRSLRNIQQWCHMLPFAVRHPRHAARMMFLLMVVQSWNWQFRGNNPPMQHLWQTWDYQEVKAAAA
jgi:cyclopropane-fatty-acyl-phospholipid synthase